MKTYKSKRITKMVALSKNNNTIHLICAVSMIVMNWVQAITGIAHCYISTQCCDIEPKN